MSEGVETQVARLDEKILALTEQVRELRERVDDWATNSARERLQIILAFGAGWLSLMIAALSTYFRK